MPAARRAAEPEQPERVVIDPADFIHQAKVLEYERVLKQTEIKKNRDWLRSMDSVHALTEEQGAWLSVWAPVKVRGSAATPEEIKETKELRKAGRLEIAIERGEALPPDEDEDEDEDAENGDS